MYPTPPSSLLSTGSFFQSTIKCRVPILKQGISSPRLCFPLLTFLSLVCLKQKVYISTCFIPIHLLKFYYMSTKVWSHIGLWRNIRYFLRSEVICSLIGTQNPSESSTGPWSGSHIIRNQKQKWREGYRSWMGVRSAEFKGLASLQYCFPNVVLCFKELYWAHFPFMYMLVIVLSLVVLSLILLLLFHRK